MQIIRFVHDGQVGIGLRGPDGAVRRLEAATIAELLRLPAAALRSTLAEAAARPGSPELAAGLRLLPPVDGLTEVWAAGVTYLRSSEARQEESASADVYAQVYEARRPELFFKGVAWRACGHNEPIGIRDDSIVNVPEPELALVLNSSGETVGVTICNDVSSRSIEGENPLYLPQAKIYNGSCAVGPWITPAWEIGSLHDLAISVQVLHGNTVRWEGETSTAQLHRALGDLVEHAVRSLAFPDGLLLSTGTGLVPDLDFTLVEDDEVEVSISGIGTLRNRVVHAADRSFSWLTPDPDRVAP